MTWGQREEGLLGGVAVVVKGVASGRVLGSHVVQRRQKLVFTEVGAMTIGCTHRTIAVGMDAGVLSQVLSVPVGITVTVIVCEGVDRVERILRESV